MSDGLKCDKKNKKGSRLWRKTKQGYGELFWRWEHGVGVLNRVLGQDLEEL